MKTTAHRLYSRAG